MRSKLLFSLCAAALLSLFGVSNVQANSACDVVAETLSAAFLLYDASCNTPRVDCDPVEGGYWMCANYNNPQYPQETVTPTEVETINEPETPTQEPVADPSTPITQEDVTSALTSCVVVGANIQIAMSKYQQECGSLPRVDCDPIGSGGEYICGSYNNPEPESTNTNTTTNTTTNTDTTTTTNTTSNTDTNNTDTTTTTDTTTPADTSASACVATGVNLDIAMQNYAKQCSLPRVDCDPTGQGAQYICGSYSNPSIADSPTREEPVVTNNDSTPEIEDPKTDTSTTQRQVPSDSRYKKGDFIALHFDNAPDPDDGHANVAVLMIVDYFGLRDTVGVVSGTYSTRTRPVYNPASEAVFYSAWGEEGYAKTWLNAHRRYAHAHAQSVDRWTKALNAGKKVWVAEGGQSDFTADVLRSIAATSPALNLKNIYVIQHSYGKQGFNESRTTVADMDYVKQRATYIPINNGNAHNGTANLNERNDLVANKFKQNAVYGTAWTAAFNYLNPYTQKFDGSDAVELLWILGLESNDIRNWTEFSNYFLPQ